MISVYYLKDEEWYQVDYTYTPNQAIRFYLQKAGLPLVHYRVRLNEARARHFTIVPDGATIEYRQVRIPS